MEDVSDPRVKDSIPTEVLDRADTEQAAEIVVDAAIRKTISPATLGRMLVDAGRSITDEGDLVALLQHVTGIAHEAIEGADYTGITIDLGGLTYTAVHTDERTLRIDSDQYAVGDGPCLHAARTRTIVLLDSEEAMARWPAFAVAARTEGVHSFLAAPLFTEDLTLGSFNLYGRSLHAFDSLDAEILDLLTTSVSRAIGDFARFKSAHDTAESIQRVLQTRAPIEQAKGVLMAMRGIGAEEAFDVLRVQSQETNVPVRVLAVDFLDKVTGSNGAKN